MSEKEKNDIPIYEKIGKDECFIISRNEDGVLVACNREGKIELSRVSYPKKED